MENDTEGNVEFVREESVKYFRKNLRYHDSWTNEEISVFEALNWAVDARIMIFSRLGSLEAN